MTPRRRRTDPVLIVKLLGMELPVSRWTASVLGVVVSLGVAGIIANHVVPELSAVVSLKQANDDLAADVNEYNRLIMETPVADVPVWNDDKGSIRVRVYKDRNVLLQAGRVTKLVRDLARAGDAPRAGDTWTDAIVARASGAACADPHFVHAGAFTWRYGDRRGDWLEVWRTYADGCQHVQMVRADGFWDSYADGTPRVRWTRCIH